MARHGVAQRFAIALFLPSTQNAAAIIEMPEHAWRKENESDQQSWFYKMYTSDPSLGGQVEWTADTSSLSFAMKTPSGFALHGKATLGDDGVAIEYQMASGSQSRLAAMQAVTCVKLYKPFTDVFLERTYVHLPDGLDLISSDTPGRTSMNAEEWLPCRYIGRVGKTAPPVPYRVEREDGVTKYFKSKAADTAFLATESKPRGWTSFTHSLSADSVFTNPARTCHYTDPISLGRPREWLACN